MLALYAPILGTRATRAYAFWARRGLLNEGAAVHARLLMKSNLARKSSEAFKGSIFFYQ